MPLNAVILNDTSTRYHHGCARVMRLLTAGLERHGLTIIHRVPARANWETDLAFAMAMKAADVVVINGEGTLHHGKPAGEALLRLATHPDRGTTPVALVNALYQDNPPAWDAYLQKIDLIAARDSESAAALSAASGSTVRWLPDLSLSATAEAGAQVREGVIVGDSVKLSSRKVLARAAAHLPGSTFIPTKTLRQNIWHLPVIGGAAKSLLYRAYNAFPALRTPRFEMPQTEAAYLERLARARLHITGRFHAVCLSMLTETPFLALASNASKIERLLRDAGMDQSRLISPDDLIQPPTDVPFSAGELEKIQAFRKKAQEDAEQLFADIATLAGQHV